MNAKVDELKLSDISVERDFIDVFPEDLSITTAMIIIFRGEHQYRLLRREAWSSFEVSVVITEEGEVTDQVSSFSSYTRKFQDVKLARIYIDEIIARNEILVTINLLLADAAECVKDAIGFEYCLASSSGWTKVEA
ncbi:hypothetical protein Tco_0477159 [Tanacetum coccineum]